MRLCKKVAMIYGYRKRFKVDELLGLRDLLIDNISETTFDDLDRLCSFGDLFIPPVGTLF